VNINKTDLEEVVMKDLIEKEIQKFVLEKKENWSDEVNSHYYDLPIIKYASAIDPSFEEYKK